MIVPEAGLSISRQCTLLGIARSSFYYRPRPEAAEELDLLKRLDRIFTDHPVYGSRRLQVALLWEGVLVGRRRVRRLMRKLASGRALTTDPLTVTIQPVQDAVRIRGQRGNDDV